MLKAGLGRVSSSTVQIRLLSIDGKLLRFRKACYGTSGKQQTVSLLSFGIAGGRGIWTIDDAVPVGGQHSRSTDVLVQPGNLSHRADAYWSDQLCFLFNI
jgi:hypothetical protein